MISTRVAVLQFSTDVLEDQCGRLKLSEGVTSDILLGLSDGDDVAAHSFLIYCPDLLDNETQSKYF